MLPKQQTQEQVNKSPVADANTMQRILHNALEHFSRYGYAGASVREITHASEVTKPTLYYYFKNKEELYKKLAQTCFDEILRTVREAAAAPGTPADRCVNVIKAYCKLTESKFAVVRFVHLMPLASERHAPDVGIAAFYNEVTDTFRQIIQSAVEAGQFEKADKAEAATYAIVAIFHMRVESILMGWHHLKEFTVVEDAVRTVLSCC